MTGYSLQRTYSIARKEVYHILRDPQALFFTLLVPIMEMFLLGYAIETNVRDVRTVVVDHANTQESRALVDSFKNSKDFKVVATVFTDEAMNREIIAGRARVGLKIPH